MKLDALDHPKTLELAVRLGVSRPTAIGHLELLWAFVGKYSAQGNVGKHSDGVIAKACDWTGSPEEFIAALVGAGFLDADKTHRLIVHDWGLHCHAWVRAKLKKLDLPFIERSSVRSSVPSSAPSATPSTSEAFSSLAKPSLVTTDAIASLRAVFPKRAGSQPWNKAEKAIAARLREGHSREEILEGAVRYAAFIRATGKEGTEYVMQASTFCGPDKRFTEPWDLPRTKAENEQGQRVSAGLEWLEGTHG